MDGAHLIAAMALAMIDIKRRGCVLSNDLLLVGTAGEEVDCLGVKAFVKAGGMKDVGALVVGEPTNGDVILSHKGAAWIELVTHGRTAHGSMSHLGNNAILHMQKLLAEVFQFQKQWKVDSDPMLGLPTISLNMLKGGLATNVVPDRCIGHLDVRLIPGQTIDDILIPLEQIVAKIQQQDQSFKAEINILNYLMPVTCSKNSYILTVAIKAANKISLKPVEIRGINYYTDASVFLAEKPLPVFFYGPGSEEMAHQPDEYVETEKYLTAIKFYTQFISDYLKL